MKGAMDAAEPWERVEELFHQALERPADQRVAFLNQECGDNPALAARVQGLLEADDGAETVVHERMVQALERALPPTGDNDEPALERIGPYRILGEVGRGGLSTVYLAERDDEHFQKRVALKLVRRGLDTDDVLLRFRYERQILARFEHPNIARLLDGGAAEDGRPYFVMEHVVGEPIDAYCAHHRLGLRQRIELFRAVCAAVSYAHQSLVVHRDLKPSNILVAEGGEPKLLDFGIAKLLDTEEFPATRPYTEKGLVLLTPEFASPEQVLGHNPTTQTDVYSLAVVLYRLLTGVAPYSLHNSRHNRFSDLVHSVCETVPPKLSAAPFSEDDLRRAGLPQDPRKIRRRLTGDLDIILGKALRKVPQRRYSSVEQFSEDLRRYLDGERVLAQPESFGYRVTKFVGRHRAMVSALSAAAVLLLTIVGFYTYQLQRERDQARWQAEKAERVSSLLVGMLEISDPSQTRGETITALELLKRAAERLETELADQPEMRSSLMELIGSIYSNLGLYAEAAPLLEKALAIRHDLVTPPHSELASILTRLGELHYNTGAYEKAEEILRDALTQHIQTLGADSPLVRRSLSDLAAVLQVRGQDKEAASLYRKALSIPRSSTGEGDPGRLVIQNNFANLLRRTGHFEEAEALARQALERQKATLGERHPEIAVTENTLALILIAVKKRQEAELLLRAGLRRQREHYGPGHPKVAASLLNLGLVLYHGRRFEEAEALYREALEIQENTPRGEPHQIENTLKNLADVALYGRGDNPGAAEWLRRCLEIQRRRLGTAHPKLSMTLLRLGAIELDLGAADRARERLEEAARIHREIEASGIPPRQRELAADLRSRLEAMAPTS